MRTVNCTEARRPLYRLLREVAEGEAIIITKRGKPIARLEPLQEARAAKRRAAVEAIRQLRKGRNLDGLSIQEMREEGRRFG